MLFWSEDHPQHSSSAKSSFWLHAPERCQHKLMSHCALMHTVRALHIDLETFGLPKASAPTPRGGTFSGPAKAEVAEAGSAWQTDLQRTVTLAKSAGLQPLDLSNVRSHIDGTDIVNAFDIGAVEASLKRPLQPSLPQGMQDILDRNNWVRDRVHDPHWLLRTAAGDGGIQIAEPPADKVGAILRRALPSLKSCLQGLPGQHTSLPPPPGKLGAPAVPSSAPAPCVVTFRNVRSVHRSKVRMDLPKFGDKAKMASPLEAQYGCKGRNGLGVNFPPPLPPLPVPAERECGVDGDGGGARPRQTGVWKRVPVLPSLELPRVQLQNTSRFDSEHGFVDGLFDTESNTLLL
jgi:hypothetical protein